MIRVTHVIDGLSVGGAEVMLASLVKEIDPARFTSTVVSLTDIGPIGAGIEELGIPVRSLGMKTSLTGALRVARLPGLLRATRPDVVQTWLYHADLLGGVATKIGARGAKVAWDVQRSTLDPEWTKRRLAIVARLCALVSRHVPTTIVSASEDASRRHVAIGYDARRIVYIPNGFDLDEFAPDPEARRSVRDELGVPQDALLAGMMARFDPQKDHRTMVRALTEVLRTRDVHFVLCGKGVEWSNPAFADLVEDQSVRSHLHLLGLRSDIARLDAALDIGILSSIGGEAFPLAIGETMACGVPCVVTDVGDTAVLVGDTGRVVHRGDPHALAEAIVSLVDLPQDARRALGEAARGRVEEHYSIASVVRRFEDLYEELATR